MLAFDDMLFVRNFYARDVCFPSLSIFPLKLFLIRKDMLSSSWIPPLFLIHPRKKVPHETNDASIQEILMCKLPHFVSSRWSSSLMAYKIEPPPPQEL